MRGSRPIARLLPDLSGAVRRSPTALAARALGSRALVISAAPSIRGRSGISLPSGRKIESAPKIDRLIDKKAIKINLLGSITTLGQQGANFGSEGGSRERLCLGVEHPATNCLLAFHQPRGPRDCLVGPSRRTALGPLFSLLLTADFTAMDFSSRCEIPSGPNPLAVPAPPAMSLLGGAIRPTGR